MAKVKSMSFSNALNLVTDDAFSSSISLKVREGSISDELHPKSVIEIDSLLKTCEINSKQQFSDICYQDNNGDNNWLSQSTLNDYKILGRTAGNEIGVLELLEEADSQGSMFPTDSYMKLDLHDVLHMAPNNSDKSVVSNLNLSSLAEHHLKFDNKSQVSKDSPIDIGFSLSDLLFDVGEHTLSAEKSNENFNFTNGTFSTSNPDILELPSSPEKEVDDEDELSILLESAETYTRPSNNLSLADLANNHFLKNSPNNIDDKLIVSTERCGNDNLELTENFESILFPDKSDVDILNREQQLSDIFGITSPVNGVLESSTEDEKIVNCIDICEETASKINLKLCCLPDTLEDKNPVNKVLKHCKNEENISDVNDTCDEIIPEIDLSFCIKKHKSPSSDNSTLTSNPESDDSGFDETDFISSKTVQNFQDFVSFKNIHTSGKEIKSTLINPKESLLSKVISCKSVSDRIKKEKLKRIKKELFMKTFPKSFTDCKQSPKVCEKVRDQSNQCVVMGINCFNVLDN